MTIVSPPALANNYRGVAGITGILTAAQSLPIFVMQNRSIRQVSDCFLAAQSVLKRRSSLCLPLLERN